MGEAAEDHLNESYANGDDLEVKQIAHTPGPWAWSWSVLPNGNADGRIYTGWNTPIGIGAPLCVAVSPRYQTKEQWEADAPVLATAPEVLTAAKAVIAWWDAFVATAKYDKQIEDAEWSEFFALRRAIAKATRL